MNQIQREFDGLGNLTKEWQAVGGAVNTESTPKVQYSWSFAPSGSNNHNRLTKITYPNGREITYEYTTGLDDNISRLSAIKDGSTTLESYTYLGYMTIVKRGHAQPGVDLTFIKQSGESNGDAGDQYIGLDRFGRIADQRWRTSSTDLERRQYGHDRNSNRTYFDNLVDTTRDELYAYDGFNQLTSMDRGTLNATKDGLTGSASRSQDWDYDGLGNWDSLTTDGGSAQTRGHNKQNEITSIAGATTPTYDANGNMTKDETGKTFEYDAWNRLRVVKSSGGSTLATYSYDALGRRVREVRGATTTDLYYSDQWQVLEERVAGTAKLSYVWSPIYIDAMICRDRDTDGNGSLDERLYPIHDANFNVVALLDTSGNVVERFAYDAFGVFFVLTPAWASRASSSYAWIYLHQGARWDADGGV